MTTKSTVQQLVDTAKTAGSMVFTVGAGSGYTLKTVGALRGCGHKVELIGGRHRGPNGMQFRLVAA